MELKEHFTTFAGSGSQIRGSRPLREYVESLSKGNRIDRHDIASAFETDISDLETLAKIRNWKQDIRGGVLKPGERSLYEVVDEAVNDTIAYEPDRNEYGFLRDSWSTADQTLRRGDGDCEDYAILKYKILKELGVSPHDMRIIIGEVDGYGQHAQLHARMPDGSVYVMDNNDPPFQIRRHHYGFNEVGVEIYMPEDAQDTAPEKAARPDPLMPPAGQQFGLPPLY